MREVEQQLHATRIQIREGLCVEVRDVVRGWVHYSDRRLRLVVSLYGTHARFKTQRLKFLGRIQDRILEEPD